jgi:hypothetical protein
MSEVKTIILRDNMRKYLKDRLSGKSMASNRSSVKGRVVIHGRDKGEQNFKLITDKSNLIVYRGRNWLMSRAFGMDMATGVRPDWYNRTIKWFGIGTGGTPVGGDPLDIASPELVDCSLAAHEDIGGLSYMETTDGGYQYKAFDGGYPLFIHDPDVPVGPEVLCTDDLTTDPVDGLDYYGDNYLVGLIQVTLDSTEGNGSGYLDLNEVGLFCSETQAGYLDADINIFARCTFSTIRKSSARELIFTWYIFF